MVKLVSLTDYLMLLVPQMMMNPKEIYNILIICFLVIILIEEWRAFKHYCYFSVWRSNIPITYFYWGGAMKIKSSIEALVLGINALLNSNKTLMILIPFSRKLTDYSNFYPLLLLSMMESSVPMEVSEPHWTTPKKSWKSIAQYKLIMIQSPKHKK